MNASNLNASATCLETRPAPRRRALRSALLLAAAFAPTLAACASDPFTAPTQEELAMTSLPGYPGAAAVVLNREEITKDDLHAAFFYNRIKILTEEGKKYADVELPFIHTTGTYEYQGNDKNLDQIVGRTIHPDGTIIPFTGKPYLKTIEKANGSWGSAKLQTMVFTLPDVEVGSIIEYRYASRINDNYYEPPDWIIQGDLYVKSAHYAWYPTAQQLVDGETHRDINAISWFPILPPDVKIEMHNIPGAGPNGADQRTYNLVVKDIPPVTHEEFMPPVANYSYRVLFNFTWAHTPEEYWKSAGKEWSHRANSFMNPGDLTSATQQIIAGATTEDQKLRRIYAAVEQIENTDYTREHDRREDKANGLSKLNHASDVLQNKRGNSSEITKLFVGMARAAGMKADLMLVPDRSRELFIPAWLNMGQFDDVIAIVTVDGKEQFFDPGSRYIPYGRLAWQHTFVQGMRQKDNETAFDKSPGEVYRDNQIQRVADLTMDDKGQISGKVDLTYIGAPALRWRQMALRGDEEGLKHNLRTNLEDLLPKSLEVKDVTITGLDDYEHPLKVSYKVNGTLGTWTGKRLVLPVDLFLAGSRATFPHEKRELAVYFRYPQEVLDAQRITFPAGFSIEASPSDTKFGLNDIGAYAMAIASAPTSFTTRRTYAFGDIIVPPANYSQLRAFYSRFETNDQQSIVLKAAPTVASASTPPPAN